MNIRPAAHQDARSIASLILRVAHHFTIDQDGNGAEDFLNTISRERMEACIQDTDIHYLAGFMDGRLAGVLAIRRNRHLYHLFVAQEYQGRGHARQLWDRAKEHAMRHGNPGEFTVNSTLIAAPVFEALGFDAIGPITRMKGVVCIPMKLCGGMHVENNNKRQGRRKSAQQ